jgi:hypothetical protein
MKKKPAKKAPKAKKKSNAPKKKTRIEKLEAVVTKLNMRLDTLEAVVQRAQPTVDFSGTSKNSVTSTVCGMPYVTTSWPVYMDYASTLAAMTK